MEIFYAGIGSRETPPEFIDEFIKIGKWLGSHGYILRSGGADGADSAFELIKSMNVDSMAKFINMPISCNDICDDVCIGCSYSCKHRNGEGMIFRWLNSEAGGIDNE